MSLTSLVRLIGIIALSIPAVAGTFMVPEASADAEWEVQSSISVGSDPIGIVVSPDGSRVYVANKGSNTVGVIDTATNSVIETISVANNPLWLAILPDGSKLYVSQFAGNSVSVIDTDTNTVSGTISVGVSPRNLAVSPDGSTVYVPNDFSNSLSVIDTTTDSVIATITGLTEPWEALVSPDGETVYVSGSSRVYEVDVSSSTVDSITVTGWARSISFNSDASLLYVAVTSGVVRVIDLASRSIINSIAVGQWPDGMALNSDGTLLYVTNADDDTISAIDTATNTVFSTLAVGDNPWGIALHPNGRVGYTTNYYEDSVNVFSLIGNSPATPSSTPNPSPKTGPAGIFLTVLGSVGDRFYGTDVLFGSYAIAPNSPYLLSWQGPSTASAPRVLQQGRVNAGGHLEEQVTLPAVASGTYKLVLTGTSATGAPLRLTNIITVDSLGEISYSTPESMQPYAG